MSTLARHAIAGQPDATLAGLVVVTAIGCGAWLAIELLAAGHPVMRTTWWPAIGTALIAWWALLLSMAAPARSRTSLRALAARAGAARMSAWTGRARPRRPTACS